MFFHLYVPLRCTNSKRNINLASAGRVLSAARFMSPELLGRFEPVAREQLRQVVRNRASQFFTVGSYKVEGRDPPTAFSEQARGGGQVCGFLFLWKMSSLNS